MVSIVWLQQEESIGLKVGRGQVSLSWKGPPGLEAALRSCPKKGLNEDLIVLCEDVLTLPVHLPIQPGKEPGDRDALRESLRWEAEPLLGFAPTGAPFDFTSGGSRNGSVGGSEWWITSVEPGTFNAWDQASRETHFKLRSASDPWCALASCLPEGNHLLVHKKRVVLACIASRRMVTFKSWSRPPGCHADGMEWFDEVSTSTEWSDIKEEVLLWDLCGLLDLEEICETLENRTGTQVRPAKLKGDEHEPWCHLLSTGAARLMRGQAPLPMVMPIQKGRSFLQTLETFFYTILGIVVIGGLLYWYHLDSTALNNLQNRATSNLSFDDKNAADTVDTLAAKRLLLENELAYYQWLIAEGQWRRKLPGDLISLIGSLDLRWGEPIRLDAITAGPKEDRYEVEFVGTATEQPSVQLLKDALADKAKAPGGLPPDRVFRKKALTFPTDGPGPGTFRIVMTWNKPEEWIMKSAGLKDEDK